MVQKLRQAQMPVSQVSQITGISERSIHRIQQEEAVTDANEVELRKSRGVGRPSSVEAYEADIAQWLAEPRSSEDGAIKVTEVLSRLRAKGYKGGKSAVYDVVRRLRPVEVPVPIVRFEGLPGEFSQHPFHATIETFDFTFRSDLKRQMLGRFLGPELVSEQRSLILEGPPGTGKTHLCIAIAYKAIQNGFMARFITAAALINELRIASDRTAALKPFLQPQVLVIDEMGYLGYGAGAADVLFQLIDQRYHQGKPTLFTTNKPLAQWGRVLHDEDLARAILDRTLHHGEYLKLSGPSYRLKGRKLDLDLVDATPAAKSKSADKLIDNSHSPPA